MKKISLKSLVWKEGKYFVSHALNVDVSSFGKTRGEALKNLVEAIKLYMEDLPKFKIREVTRPAIVNNAL
ncbi:MAG: type II toxin-antitoxin system HicB family antitoxin [Candidatus Paceibacterota bacterium]|jgi:predicted RNase H-like HicB family nuclease